MSGTCLAILSASLGVERVRFRVSGENLDLLVKRAGRTVLGNTVRPRNLIARRAKERRNG